MYRVNRRSISSFNFQPSLRSAFNTRVKDAPLPCEEKPHEIVVSQMSNGARLITQELNGPMAAVGIYCLGAGAKADPKSLPGLNYVLRWALMTSNMNDSLFQLDKAVRSIGASLEHEEIRKHTLGWKLECRRDAFMKPLAIMRNCITVPRFAESDTNRFRDTMDAVLEELRWQNPRKFVVEALEQVAFFKEPCGNPRYVPASFNDDCTSEALLAQWCKVFHPKNIVIAGVNVDHGCLVAEYENSEYSHSTAAPHFRNSEVATIPMLNEEAQYQGGRDEFFVEKRYKEMSTKPFLENETIVALGWRAKGYDGSVKEYATSLVAQQMIDIALQDGLRVEFGLDKGLRSFYSPLSTVGLIGITTRTAPSAATSAVNEAVQVMNRAVSEGSLKAAVKRAQVRFLHDTVETRRDYIDYLATTVVPLGQSRTVEATIQAIQSVTLTDVQAAFKYSQQAAPVMYCMGSCDVPSLRQLGLTK